MKNLVFVAVLLLGFCAISVAQEIPQLEVFGGWSYLRPDGGSPNNPMGWIASATVNINKFAGVVMEANGGYTNEETGLSQHTFLVGPRFAIRTGDRFKTFYHAMFGATHVGYEYQPNINGFTMVYGGGLDVSVNKRFEIRPFQLDYMISKIAGEWEPALRFSAGVVVNIGEF
jgi:hypothetical protein